MTSKLNCACHIQWPIKCYWCLGIRMFDIWISPSCLLWYVLYFQLLCYVGMLFVISCLLHRKDYRFERYGILLTVWCGSIFLCRPLHCIQKHRILYCTWVLICCSVHLKPAILNELLLLHVGPYWHYFWRNFVCFISLDSFFVLDIKWTTLE